MVTNDWKTALVMMIFITVMIVILAYIMYKCPRGKSTSADEQQNQQFMPPPMPTSASEPWFLVVYDEPFHVSYMFAADDVLKIRYNQKGDIRIMCKSQTYPSSDNDVILEGQFQFEFRPASQVGDYLEGDEE